MFRVLVIFFLPLFWREGTGKNTRVRYKRTKKDDIRVDSAREREREREREEIANDSESEREIRTLF